MLRSPLVDFFGVDLAAAVHPLGREGVELVDRSRAGDEFEEGSLLEREQIGQYVVDRFGVDALEGGRDALVLGFVGEVVEAHIIHFITETEDEFLRHIELALVFFDPFGHFLEDVGLKVRVSDHAVEDQVVLVPPFARVAAADDLAVGIQVPFVAFEEAGAAESLAVLLVLAPVHVQIHFPIQVLNHGFDFLGLQPSAEDDPDPVGGCSAAAVFALRAGRQRVSFDQRFGGVQVQVGQHRFAG